MLIHTIAEHNLVIALCNTNDLLLTQSTDNKARLFDLRAGANLTLAKIVEMVISVRIAALKQ